MACWPSRVPIHHGAWQSPQGMWIHQEKPPIKRLIKLLMSSHPSDAKHPLATQKSSHNNAGGKARKGVSLFAPLLGLSTVKLLCVKTEQQSPQDHSAKGSMWVLQHTHWVPLLHSPDPCPCTLPPQAHLRPQRLERQVSRKTHPGVSPAAADAVARLLLALARPLW